MQKSYLSCGFSLNGYYVKIEQAEQARPDDDDDDELFLSESDGGCGEEKSFVAAPSG